MPCADGKGTIALERTNCNGFFGRQSAVDVHLDVVAIPGDSHMVPLIGRRGRDAETEIAIVQNIEFQFTAVLPDGPSSVFHRVGFGEDTQVAGAVGLIPYRGGEGVFTKFQPWIVREDEGTFGVYSLLVFPVFIRDIGCG